MLRRWSERAAETPDAPAIVSHDRTLSYADVLREIESRGGGDNPVALVGAVTVERALDLLAAIERHAPVLLLHPRWTERETARVLERLASVKRERDGEEGALAVVHTSGTSGTPRGAVLSRAAFALAARASAAHLGASPKDRWLLSMPLAHVGGLGIVMRSLVQETPLVVMEGALDETRFLDLVRRARVSHVSLVPTMLARLLERTDAEAWPESLRCILLGGAACPASILESAIARGLPVHPTYGLTETCGQVATRRTPATAASDADAMDVLPGVEVRIVDGAISIRSPALLDGWLGELGSPLDEDGFYATGDLGELVDGRLRVHARRTDLVITGGENVYPREVEDALERIPGVHAASVFGVPDVRWGQRVAAAIVAERDLADGAIVAALASELASFKMPRLLARLDALPVGASGKLDRRAAQALALPLLTPLTGFPSDSNESVR